MKRWQSGFTIVEVVLFLAITGLLTVGLLAGVSAALRQQQYHDAVQSFAGFIRDQYSRVISIENDRGNRDTCPVKGATNDGARGQSNCVVVGRYVKSTNSEARSFTAYPLYALKRSGVWTYSYSESEANTYTVGWGAQVRSLTATNTIGRELALLIYRDPDSGQGIVRTNDAPYSPANIDNFIRNMQPNGGMYTADLQLRQREFCIYDTGWSVGQRLSVFLGAKAGSSEAVTVGHATKGCDNEATA